MVVAGWEMVAAVLAVVDLELRRGAVRFCMRWGGMAG